jgi:SSS family solute:Na+ symporter
MNGTILALLLYLIAVVAVGIVASRRAGRNLGEFYLGGRAMSELVVALSAVVSGRSAWLMMGMVGLTFVYGVRMAWFIPGYVIAELLMFLFAAQRIRRFTERHDNVTFVDYFASRFGDSNGLLRVLAAAIIVVFFTAYVGAQLKAGQVMFNLLFGWESVLAGIALMALIVGFYTMVGGYRAVSITDVACRRLRQGWGTGGGVADLGAGGLCRGRQLFAGRDRQSGGGDQWAGHRLRLAGQSAHHRALHVDR